ncbi:MAG TPA: hypothetical protein VLA90_10835, partial [Actinomycetota bacterium]|nr:hypothetical protein [Actinomycetota bacterium]
MRGGARLVVMVTGALLLIPGSAAANGGAYFDLDRTHVTPGERTAVRAYVFVPERKQHLLEQGPFYVYLLPKGAWIREGRPVPDEAIRLGALTLEPERRETFELELEFNVPEVPSGFYSLGACNDPCTLSGLREPLSGELSIVETPREADLLTRQFKLETRIWRLQRDVRRAERRLERAIMQLAQSQEDNDVLAEMVNEARGELRAAQSQPRAPAAVEAEERPLVDGRVLIATALLLVVAAALRGRRRPAGAEIPSP